MTGEGSDPSDTDCEVLTVEAYKRAELGPNDSISQDEFIVFCRFKTGEGCQDLRVLMKSSGVLDETPPEVATPDVAVPQSSPETEVRLRSSKWWACALVRYDVVMLCYKPIHLSEGCAYVLV